MNPIINYCYIESDGVDIFTVILLPEADKKYPVVIIRTPYVDDMEVLSEDFIAATYYNIYFQWLKRGYAIVIQHTRGRGKSMGDCIPYINEREDGLLLQQWIRTQSFYNGEIFLLGASYLTSVHYATAPFADDIKGAVFEVQDCERYNICYRNGFFKIGLHGNWYINDMYKAKSKLKKNYTPNSFNLLPLKNLTKMVFGENAKDFDEMLKATNRDNPFWNTRYGGNDARNAVRNVKFPVLFTTGFYDIYTGGIFDMWNSMSDAAKEKCSLVVSPYDHGDGYISNESIHFKNGKRIEQFGQYYAIDWFDAIRNCTKMPFEQGKVTYYRLFENKWKTDNFSKQKYEKNITLGKKKITYTYNPYDAPRFKGGLSCNFGGAVYQDKPNLRHDIVTVYTESFDKDTFVKGKMSANLHVKSDCEDTCFYVRISIEKEHGDFGLRDDITSICYQRKSYTPNEEVDLYFNFDEHAFLIRRGERLRIDIASADSEHYVRHTNNKGLFSEQTTAKVAHNTVDLSKSTLTLPIDYYK